MTLEEVSSSFRDPSGLVFTRDDVLHRQVNRSFREQFDRLIGSGLYEALVAEHLLVPHEEADLSLAATSQAYKVLKPARVPFVSYPYEWSFGQLKDAALCTLAAQRLAMDRGMSLRDATAYNVQFVDGRPLLIDTLSFEALPEGRPWVAYRQFCQHFLAPLALMSFRDVRAGQLARVHMDGVPLDLAVALLPAAARRRLSLSMHLFAHARSQRRHERAGATGEAPRQARPFSSQAFRGLIDSLEKAVRKLGWEPESSVWAGYYREAESYTDDALEHKKELVGKFLEEAAPKSLWDLGANTGLFSRIGAGMGIPTVAFDLDPGAVEVNYREVRARGETNLLPLIMDLTNPSPAIGWENKERLSLLERGPADMVLALALVHHLAIDNNVPLPRLAAFLRSLCSWLAVEFVPKSDPKVQTLLATREDVFPDYSQDAFERAFEAEGAFTVERREPVRGSQRVLYLMRAR